MENRVDCLLLFGSWCRCIVVAVLFSGWPLLLSMLCKRKIYAIEIGAIYTFSIQAHCHKCCAPIEKHPHREPTTEKKNNSGRADDKFIEFYCWTIFCFWHFAGTSAFNRFAPFNRHTRYIVRAITNSKIKYTGNKHFNTCACWLLPEPNGLLFDNCMQQELRYFYHRIHLMLLLMECCAL